MITQIIDLCPVCKVGTSSEVEKYSKERRNKDLESSPYLWFLKYGNDQSNIQLCLASASYSGNVSPLEFRVPRAGM